jgi:hypothetical protein
MSDYEILGVPENASLEDVKSAYRSAVKHLHPDVNDAPNAAAMFRLVQDAYDRILSGKPQMSEPVPKPEVQIVYRDIYHEPAESPRDDSHVSYEDTWNSPSEKAKRMLLCMVGKSAASAVLPILLNRIATGHWFSACAASPLELAFLLSLSYFAFSIFHYIFLLVQEVKYSFVLTVAALVLLWKFFFTKLEIFQTEVVGDYASIVVLCIPVLVDFLILMTNITRVLLAKKQRKQ